MVIKYSYGAEGSLSVPAGQTIKFYIGGSQVAYFGLAGLYSSAVHAVEMWGDLFICQVGSGTAVYGYALGDGDSIGQDSGYLYLDPNGDWVNGLVIGSLSAPVDLQVTNNFIVGGKYIEMTQAGMGIILASPNGTRYLITVSDLGILQVSLI